MPFSSKDASRHTRKARGNPKANRAFQHAANATLKRTGDDARAVRVGNFAAAQAARKSARGKRSQSRKSGRG